MKVLRISPVDFAILTCALRPDDRDARGRPFLRQRSRWARLRRLCAVSCALPCLVGPSVVVAQTPSPLQEWQYSGGVVLEKVYEGEVPEWRRIVGLAAAVQPLYEGSRANRLRGGPVVNIRYRDIAFASTGEGLGINLLRGRQFRAGVSLGYDLGRRNSSDTHLNGLADLGPAAVPKMFAEGVISKDFPMIIRADVRRIVRSGDGLVGDVEAYMPLPGSSRRFVMFAGPTYTFANRQHMQRVFGVNSAEAQNAGYPAFDTHGGSVAKGLGFSATWFPSEHWLVNFDGAVNRLLGSAGQSPITQRRTQRAFAVSAAYQW